jgi:hypothetical protein
MKVDFSRRSTITILSEAQGLLLKTTQKRGTHAVAVKNRCGFHSRARGVKERV